MSAEPPSTTTSENPSRDAHDWGQLATHNAALPLLEEALDALDGRVEFADVRLVEAEELRSYHRQGQDTDDRHEHSVGIGVRVLVDGTWGFASRPLSQTGDPARAAARALRVAELSARAAGPPVRFPPQPGVNGCYRTTVAEDPFAVDFDTRHQLLEDALAAASASKQVRSVEVGVNAKRQHRHLANTEGSRQHQHFLECGAGVVAMASNGEDLQRRSYPNSFHGNTAAGGWEYVRGLRLTDNAARVGDEACALLTAPRAAAGRADLVIGSQQVALQIHESCGHALELDRMLGDERNFAGTSFIDVRDIGRLRYGSPAVNITSDPTIEGTRGSFAFDDEGTPGRRTPLIASGIAVNTLSTRETAARAGLAATGAARSDGWAYLPVCFATHVYLEPGQGSLEDLLERLGSGYFIDDNRSWSIDNNRMNFQFGTEVAYEVRGGKRRRLVKNFSYGGSTPQFWGAVEAVGGPNELKIFGYPCGKGEPKQWGFLSHAAPPVLVRGVQTGVAR